MHENLLIGAKIFKSTRCSVIVSLLHSFYTVAAEGINQGKNASYQERGQAQQHTGNVYSPVGGAIATQVGIPTLALI